MLRIRLRRVGKKGRPSYRIVVAESAAPRDGAYVEWVGNYDPLQDPPAYTVKTDRVQEWLRKGAQPTDAVRRILEWSAANAVDEDAGDGPAESTGAEEPAEVGAAGDEAAA